MPITQAVTRIASEDELTDVLAAYGLLGPLVRVPASVSARQFKLQLLAEGLLDQVETFVTSQGAAVQIAYDNSGTFVRTEFAHADLGADARNVDVEQARGGALERSVHGSSFL
ncbi:hypothetical protein NKJ52_20605 [Mesorhizobium australicum]|uniref:hypothetical protein n=1 Tax=Mesorhizobium australicum TaxID=536018 RepID=UPI0033362BFF